MMKPQMFIDAVAEIVALPVFPRRTTSGGAIMALLAKLVDRPNRLRWLVDTVVNYVGEWPGPAQLRALYATRYPPADGIEGTHCKIAGFTPSESESASLEGHETIKRLLEGDQRRGGGLKRLN